MAVMAGSVCTGGKNDWHFLWLIVFCSVLGHGAAEKSGDCRND